MSLSRKVAIIAAGGLATVSLASSGAWAFFTASGTAAATAQVGTVNAPTGVTALQTVPGTGAVHVQWTAPALSGTPLTGYYVEGLIGSTASPACGSSAIALLASGVSHCDDLDAPGSDAYRVTAVYGTWTAPSGPTS
jgi:hypothetical protein